MAPGMRLSCSTSSIPRQPSPWSPGPGPRVTGLCILKGKQQRCTSRLPPWSGRPFWGELLVMQAAIRAGSHLTPPGSSWVSQTVCSPLLYV